MSPRADVLAVILSSLCAIGPASADGPPPVSVYDIQGRRVGTMDAAGGGAAGLRAPAPRGGFEMRALRGGAVVNRDGAPAELPAGLYFLGPATDPILASPPSQIATLGFQDLTSIVLPQQLWDADDMEARDVNGDGRTDLVFSIYYSCDPTPAYPFRIWIQTPQRRFVDETEARVPLYLRMGHDLELFDADADGDVDVFLAGYDCGANQAAAALFINDGAGSFTNESALRLPSLGGSSIVYSAASGLLDDDAFRDIAVVIQPDSTYRPQAELWLNNGAGVFQRALDRLPTAVDYGYLGVSVANLAGDARDDIVFANGRVDVVDINGNPVDSLSGRPALFRNTGGGHFADETAARMPSDDKRVEFYLAIADVDGDGDLDILEPGHVFGDNVPLLRLLVNDGAGVFSASGGSGLDGYSGIFNRPRFGLLNDDGFPDLFIPTVQPGVADADLLLVNDGAGSFADASSALPPVIDFSFGCALLGYDPDADTDIATANGGSGFGDAGQNRLYRNLVQPVAVGSAMPPHALRLGLPFPSPGVDRISIRFSLPREAEARLGIFDLGGREVRELSSGRLPEGDHVASWDLRDTDGNRVIAGLFFCRLEVDGRSCGRKIVVVP